MENVSSMIELPQPSDQRKANRKQTNVNMNN